MPKFSILLITYNQEKYIEETIYSILNQTYQDFEIIVSDDSSADNTLDVAKSVNDNRVKIFSTPFNVGINGNLNNAIKNASGDYLILLGGDDKLRGTYLERLDEIFNTNDVDVVYPQLTSIDQDSNYIIGENCFYWEFKNRLKEEMLNHLFLNGNCVPSPGMCLKREAILSIYPLDYSLILYQDYKMHADLLINGYKNIVLNDIFVEYRQFHDERNISNNTNGVGETRALLDTDKFMDSFLKINDIKLLESIFKEEIDKTGIIPYSDTITFFLGQMALLSKDERKQVWGYKQIAKFISTFENYKLVKDVYNFDFKEFAGLVKRIYNKNNEKENEITVYKIKYKKYKTLFNGVLVITVVSILLNILFLVGKVMYGL